MKLKMSVAVVAVTTALTACNEVAEPAADPVASPAAKVQLKTDDQKINYAFGASMAERITSNFDLDLDPFVAGFRDTVTGNQQMSGQEMADALRLFQERAMAQMEAEQKAHQAEQAKLAAENQAKAEAFLSANAQKEGVVQLPSGLQYKIVSEGSGAKPGVDDQVTVHYRGTLIDGKEFDSSYSRNSPATFGVSQVISGWTEALQLMPEGSKWELYIPSELGYGDTGAGGLIGPNAALVFEVELLKVDAAEVAEALTSEDAG